MTKSDARAARQTRQGRTARVVTSAARGPQIRGIECVTAARERANVVNGIRVARTFRAVDLAPMAIAGEDCQSGAFPERGAENAARSTHIAANLTDSDSASLDTPRIQSELGTGSREVAT